VRQAAVAIIALGVLTTGCNRKPEGQTVAVVNGEEITLPDLNFALNSTNVPEGADKTVVRSQILQQLVDRRLLAEQARKEGIDKSPDYLNRVRRADEDMLISMLAAKRLKTAQLPSDREVEGYISGHPNMFDKREVWELQQISYPTPTDPGILSEIVKASTMPALIAVLQAHNIAFQEQKNRVDTAVIPSEMYGKINAVPSGEPFVVRAGKNSVANVITSKQPQPISGPKAKPLAVETIRKTQTAKALEGLVNSLRGSAKLEYQPGYAPAAKK
jgi:peptidyl-prolyl cis-trans isomerase C